MMDSVDGDFGHKDDFGRLVQDYNTTEIMYAFLHIPVCCQLKRGIAAQQCCSTITNEWVKELLKPCAGDKAAIP